MRVNVFLVCGFFGLLLNGLLFNIFLFVKGLFILLKGLFEENVIKEFDKLFLNGFLLLNILFFFVGVKVVNKFWFLNVDGNNLEGCFVGVKGFKLLFLEVLFVDFWGKLKFVKKLLLNGLEKFLFFCFEDVFCEFG